MDSPTGHSAQVLADAEAHAGALADMVDAYLKGVRLAKSRPNSREWRAATREYLRANLVYTRLTGMTRDDAAAKARSIAECFTS